MRRAEKAKAAYCCCIVTNVLQDTQFDEELDDVLKNYDFPSFPSLDRLDPKLTFKIKKSI